MHKKIIDNLSIILKIFFIGIILVIIINLKNIASIRGVDPQIVSDWATMSSALLDTTTTTIKLNADITCASDTTIGNKPGNLIIDGQGIYTFNSGTYTSTFTSSSTFNSVTFQNIILKGTNSNGIVNSSSSSLSPTINFNNIVFTGERIANNNYGIINFTNCDITSNLECAQCAVVNINGSGGEDLLSPSGNRFKRSGGSGRSIFRLYWLLNNSQIGNITINPGAVAYCENSSDTSYGLCYPSASSKAQLIISGGAKFNYSGNLLTGSNRFDKICLLDGTDLNRTVFNDTISSTAASYDLLRTSSDLVVGKYADLNISGAPNGNMGINVGGNFTIDDYSNVSLTLNKNLTSYGISVAGNIFSVGNYSSTTITPQGTSTNYAISMQSSESLFSIGNFSTLIINPPTTGTSNMNSINLKGSGGIVIGDNCTIKLEAIGKSGIWALLHSDQQITIGKNTYLEANASGGAIASVIYSKNNTISIGEGSKFYVSATITSTPFSPVYASKDIIADRNTDCRVTIYGSGISLPVVNANGNILIGSSISSDPDDLTQFIVTSYAPMDRHFIYAGKDLNIYNNSNLIVTPQNTSTTNSIYISGNLTINDNSSIVVNPPASGTSNYNGVYISGSTGLSIGNSSKFYLSSSGMNTSSNLLDVTAGSIVTGKNSDVIVYASGASSSNLVNVSGNLTIGADTGTKDDNTRFIAYSETSTQNNNLVKVSGNMIVNPFSKFEAVTTQNVKTITSGSGYLVNLLSNSSNLTVNNGAQFHLIGQDISSNKAALLYLNGTSGKTNFNSPKNVIFYSSKKSPLVKYGSQNSFNINNVQQVNYWGEITNSNPNIFNSITNSYEKPLYSFRGADDSVDISITASMSDTAGVFNSTSSNSINRVGIASSIDGSGPTPAKLDMSKAYIVSFGSLVPNIKYSYIEETQMNNFEISTPSMPYIGKTIFPNITIMNDPTAVGFFYKFNLNDQYSAAPPILYINPPTDTNTFNFTSQIPAIWEVRVYQGYLISQFSDIVLRSNEIFDVDESILGNTSPLANISAHYKINNIPYTLNGISDTNGNFIIPTQRIPMYAQVTITVIKGSTIMEIPVLVKPSGNLLYFKQLPNLILFNNAIVSTRLQYATREDRDFKIVIADNRYYGGDWSINVRASPLKTVNGNVLSANFVFITEDGNEIELNDYDTQIAVGNNSSYTENVLQWDEDRGLLLKIYPIDQLADEEYKGYITWTLMDVP